MCVKYNFNVFLICCLTFGNTQLIINVKNQGGDIVQESISVNESINAITVEFQRSDGTLVTQFIDFTNEVEILKALVLGEEERGQSQYQVMCFVCRYQRGNFIPVDAMAKLRQKNPGTIRVPEKEISPENYTMDYVLDLSKSTVISRHIAELCGEAVDATYTRHEDISAWAQRPGASESLLLSAVHDVSNENFPTCHNILERNEPCQCRLELCIGWYPCGLKYCKGKSEGKEATIGSYRCGIKTCKKCYIFVYRVQHKQLCLWDE